MSLEELPSKVASWLRALFARKRIRGVPVEQTSLSIFQLPDEIFINIFSNFSSFRLEHAYYRVDQHDRSVIDRRYFNRTLAERHRILVAFTQLCHPTRQRFLPWLWEHVQSLCIRSPAAQEQECRQLAKLMFRRQSKMLVATPSLAAHVKTLSVHMFRSNAPRLVKLLPLLPNLDTLEILTEYYGEPERLERLFKRIQLPQIRTLVIDAQDHYFMKCCANVKRVIIHQRGFDYAYLNSIPFVANSLVYLALCLPVTENIRDLVRLCPNLEELGIVQPYGFQTLDCISAVQGFRKLRLLEVVLPCRSDTYFPHTRPVWESVMKEHAIIVLRGIHGHIKVLKMISIGGFPRWEDIHDAETQVIAVP